MKPTQKVVLLWLAWAIILIGYQTLVDARFDPKRPDNALFWTPSETTATSNKGKIYLEEPFLNTQVAWDSEYYLSIATEGYNDPAVSGIPADFNWDNNPQRCKPGKPPTCYSRNYAFFPFYPYLSRIIALPLRLFLTPIAASTLAEVLVSLLGTLGAMLALYYLTKDELEESGALRAVFYLLIFPSAFFLAQVYTEGLFLGLTFGSLAFLKRRRWFLAGLLAAFATWTRAAGGMLFIPLIGTWVVDLIRLLYYRQVKSTAEATSESEETASPPKLRLKTTLLNLVWVFLPVLAYFIWNAGLGPAFHVVEDHYFTRGFLLFGPSLWAWGEAFKAFTSNNLQARTYYAVEFGAIILALVACALTMKRYPWISTFGLMVILFSFFSGAAQGMHRYVLAVPSIFIVLARWGKNPVFDRAWTILSVLVMGLMATLFTFDFWAG